MNKRELRQFISLVAKNATLGVAVAAVATSLFSISSLVKFNADMARNAVPYLAGVAAAAVYAYVLILYFQYRRRKHAPSAFIAYSREDSDFVKKLAQDLESNNVKPLLDTLHLKVGDDIKSALGRLVDECDFFIFVSLPASANSGWALTELKRAKDRNVPILPVLKAGTELPEDLKGIYYANFTESYEEGLNELLSPMTGKKTYVAVSESQA